MVDNLTTTRPKKALKAFAISEAEQALIAAIELDDNVAAIAIAQEAKLDICGRDNLYLRVAAIHGRIKILTALVANGANVHSRQDESLRMACRYGHLDCAKYLVSCGVVLVKEDLDTAVNLGQTKIAAYIQTQLGISAPAPAAPAAIQEKPKVYKPRPPRGSDPGSEPDSEPDSES